MWIIVKNKFGVSCTEWTKKKIKIRAIPWDGENMFISNFLRPIILAPFHF